eukprot:5129232-Pleurochrysis_carterae.AAC.1
MARMCAREEVRADEQEHEQEQMKVREGRESNKSRKGRRIREMEDGWMGRRTEARERKGIRNCKQQNEEADVAGEKGMSWE